MKKVLAELLQPRFSVVAQARNGDEALTAVERLRPRLAIFDVSMPKLNGFEVARKLIASQSSTKIVFLTLLSGEEFIDEARRYRLLVARLHALYVASRKPSDTSVEADPDVPIRNLNH